MKKKIEIIFEDEEIVIINKPPKFLTLPDRYATGINNIYGYLNSLYGKVFIVHRLDKETSGILCFAKNEDAHRELCRQFEARTVKKTYLTLVEGTPHHEEGKVDKPIAEHSFIQGKMVIAKRGKTSVTLYKILEKFKNYSLLSAEIKTGRMHQIRVHFQSIGYPLAVDSTYGRKEAFYLSEIKGGKYLLGKNQEERPLIDRSILHAHELILNHPKTGERMAFQAELPKDFAAVLRQLRKWGKR